MAIRSLFIFYALFFLLLGWQVADRTVWYAEVIPLLCVYLLLLLTMRVFRFSLLSYIAVFIPLMWHTVGAHYTFSQVPFSFVMDWLGLERNPYDRIGHFMVGFFVLPVSEYLIRHRLSTRLVAVFFAVFAIGTVAAVYEIIEWGYAALEGGQSGISFLGAQGDVWDAQKDMLADLLGALLTAPLAYVYQRRMNITEP
ncbi:MAG: hypothetical protein CMI02_16720 [Oceanospirillaceae bacterium]|nr:hypothetical protein [Oceanospirillaceae bacterium]MBT13665.1 hypothetical protein [Oceanospirillaceae bacterium]|tara:strand:+ start:11810 stop:12400 length:591 start_codon:yes stop_codon:yes gene_type:complete